MKTKMNATCVVCGTLAPAPTPAPAGHPYSPIPDTVTKYVTPLRGALLRTPWGNNTVFVHADGAVTGLE